VVKPKM